MSVPRVMSSGPREWLGRAVTAVLLCVVVLSALCSDLTSASEDPKKTTQMRRDKRNTQQRLPTQLRHILNQLNRGSGNPNNMDLLQYTPATPRPGDVNCYIELQVVHRIGGRCVPLGSRGSRMGCQAGINLAPSPDCTRTSSTSSAQQTSTGQGPVLAWMRSGRGRHRSRRQPMRGLSRPAH